MSDPKTRGAFRVLARIYALDMLAMVALIGIASALVAAGVYIPETALAGMEFTLPIILMVVIGAPVMEEIAFRGWLSGKPGPVIALLLLAAGGVGATLPSHRKPGGRRFGWSGRFGWWRSWPCSFYGSGL